MSSGAIDVWAYRNEHASTFSIGPYADDLDESISLPRGTEKDREHNDAVTRAIAQTHAQRRTAMAEAISARQRGDVSAVVLNANDGSSAPSVSGRAYNKFGHHHRHVVTPLAEDVPPPLSALRTLTRPLPANAMETLHSLRTLPVVPSQINNSEDVSIIITDGNANDAVRKAAQTLAGRGRPHTGEDGLREAFEGEAAATRLLGDLALLDAVAPPMVVSDLLNPPNRIGGGGVLSAYAVNGGHSGHNGEEEEGGRDALVQQRNAVLNGRNGTNPHGEPLSYVTCSAARTDVLALVRGGGRERDGEGEGGAHGLPLPHITSAEFAEVVADFRPRLGGADSFVTAMGLPAPHCIVRKSRRGLAADAIRHDVAVHGGNREERAEQFIGQLRDAQRKKGFEVGGSAKGRGGSGEAEAASAAAIFLHLLGDDGPSNNDGAEASEPHPMLRNQWAAIDAVPLGIGSTPQKHTSSTLENGPAFEAHTVTASGPGDRHGPNRYFHRSSRGVKEAEAALVSAGTDRQHGLNESHGNNGAADRSGRLLTSNQRATGGPTNEGSTFAVTTPLERNRLAALQSRVLGPTAEGLAASTAYTTTLGDLGGGGGVVGKAAAQRGGALLHAYGAAPLAGAWGQPPAVATEGAALLGDLVEVRDEAFKVTGQPAPTLRSAAMAHTVTTQTLRSQKEMARALHLGGTLTGAPPKPPRTISLGPGYGKLL